MTVPLVVSRRLRWRRRLNRHAPTGSISARDPGPDSQPPLALGAACYFKRYNVLIARLPRKSSAYSRERDDAANVSKTIRYPNQIGSIHFIAAFCAFCALATAPRNCTLCVILLVARGLALNPILIVQRLRPPRSSRIRPRTTIVLLGGGTLRSRPRRAARTEARLDRAHDATAELYRECRRTGAACAPS